MNKSIYFLTLASLLLLNGCEEYKPEVNEENCAIPMKETREKFNNDDKWRQFNSECNGFKARVYLERMKKDREENTPKKEIGNKSIFAE